MIRCDRCKKAFDKCFVTNRESGLILCDDCAAMPAVDLPFQPCLCSLCSGEINWPSEKRIHENKIICAHCFKAMIEKRYPVMVFTPPHEGGSTVREFCRDKSGNGNDLIPGGTWESKMKDDRTTHNGVGTSHCPDFSQIPLEALVSLARRYELGAKKHGKDNWRPGIKDKSYCIERLNHVINHAFTLIGKLEGRIENDGDDDAGAILWGGALAVLATKEHLDDNQT